MAIYGVFMICGQTWALEFGVIFGGMLGKSELAVQSMTQQTQQLVLMIPGSICCATIVRVGLKLGAGRARSAQALSKLAVAVNATMGVVYCLLLISLAQYVPLLFTDIPEVVSLATDMLYINAAYRTFDFIGVAIGGTLRGCGRQHTGALIIAVGYLFVFPVAVPLMFYTPFSIYGFWIPMGISSCTQCAILFYIVFHIDWQAEVTKAEARTAKNNQDKNNRTNESAFPGEPCEDEKCPLIKYKNISSVSMVTRRLVVSRILAGVCCLLILALGILCRVYFPPLQPPSAGDTPANVTTAAGLTEETYTVL